MHRVVIEGGEGLFARTEDFPNPSAQARLAALVGLDDLIDRLVTDAGVLLVMSSRCRIPGLPGARISRTVADLL